MPLRLLVYGGRAYPDKAFVFAALDHLHKSRGLEVVIEGEAGQEDSSGTVLCGADKLARAWAQARGVDYLPFPVSAREWREIGPRAGPLRNRRMLEEGKPNAALEFEGGKGTRDMRNVLERAGVPVWCPKPLEVSSHG
jgi:hypothetical protein